MVREKKTINRRRDYFIKKWFQFKFSLIFIIAIIVGSAIFGSYLIGEIRDYLDYICNTSHISVLNTWEVISPIFLKVSLFLIIVLLILFLTIIFLTTKKFSKGFNIILNDLHLLRGGDLASDFDDSKIPEELEVFSEDYKDAKDYLKTIISEVKENINKMEAALNKLEAHSNEKSQKGVAASFEELDFYHNKLQNSINKITYKE